RIEPLAETRELVGELIELLRARFLRALACEGLHRLAQALELAWIRAGRGLHAHGERLQLLVANLGVASETRDLAVLLGDCGRGGRDGRGERVETLGDQVEASLEALVDLRVALRREHGPRRVRSTPVPRESQEQRACLGGVSARRARRPLTRIRDYWPARQSR